MEPTTQNTSNEAKKTLWMTIISIIIIVLLIWGGVYMYRNRPAGSDILNVPATTNSTSTKTNLGEDDRVVTVDEKVAITNYLRDRINQLSTKKPASGRTFTVNNVVVEAAGRAVVEYSDGVTTRDAAVGYTIDSSGMIVIISFDILEK